MLRYLALLTCTLCPAGLYDTVEAAVNEVTYTPPPLPSTLLSPVPRTPSQQEYITSLSKPHKVSVPTSAPVEMHVRKELSNPHSRAKKQARWQTAQIRSKVLLQEYIQAEYANLAGRTKSDARAEATRAMWTFMIDSKYLHGLVSAKMRGEAWMQVGPAKRHEFQP